MEKLISKLPIYILYQENNFEKINFTLSEKNNTFSDVTHHYKWFDHDGMVQMN